jgi:hypothetical protein
MYRKGLPSGREKPKHAEKIRCFIKRREYTADIWGGFYAKDTGGG